MNDLGSSRARWVVGGSLLLLGLTACGGGNVATVTVTNTATVTVSPTAVPTVPTVSGAAGTSGGTRPVPSSTAGTSGTSTAPATSPALEASMAPLGSPVPTSAAQETILTVRLQAYDPATGTLTFVPQDAIETEGAASAVLSDPVGATPLTARVTAQTNVKFATYGTDIAAAIKANDVYCNMVLQGEQVTWLYEVYVT